MINDRELEILINEVYENYGYDFSGYSMASFKRRVDRLYQLDGFTNFPAFLEKIIDDSDYFSRMVEEITVNITEMFRDPHFYNILRNEILPVLATKPFIRLWHAGCSTGEEVYSMAILLKEADLLHKSLLYATDISPMVLEVARKGVFPLRMMKQYSENYMASGGKKDFSHYYTANYGLAKFGEDLSSKMVFSQHNLVSDRSFNEFDLILCRNVLIYFDKDLQERALHLFDDSLSKLGYLALGSKETIKFTSMQKRYKQFEKEKIWRKTN
ncbi:chemotaxis protein methyltransferase CheR [Flavobacterium arsenatis]|uniref:Chemotaxis protein methyltransferase CheR n=1 Tax=Flavobacterium arsenatis TaxID=1484332 RepID=A0ABU1TNJ6_9FLAO|nr:protein-glutamate O-methyltransferase CheR [Flavobacterium arsenatis]MDR6967539.1 chemotaxis protein methyltransferase CheR [Flavobacterium arsenatis]